MLFRCHILGSKVRVRNNDIRLRQSVHRRSEQGWQFLGGSDQGSVGLWLSRDHHGGLQRKVHGKALIFGTFSEVAFNNNYLCKDAQNLLKSRISRFHNRIRQKSSFYIISAKLILKEGATYDMLKK